VVSLVPAGGESGAAFWLRERDGAAWLLKVTRAPVSGLQALDATTGRLRARGYPAPRLRAIGQLGSGRASWIQERLPGRDLCLAGGDPDCVALSRLLPVLFRLNDAQAGLGGGGTDWRHLITTTLLAGGDGYCLHSTMAARPDTRELLAAVRGIGASCGSAIPPGVDFTHFDFHFMNLLSDGATITGVVDINPPPQAGDRAFDLATLVFYVYDHDELRRRILDRSSAWLAGWPAGRPGLPRAHGAPAGGVVSPPLSLGPGHPAPSPPGPAHPQRHRRSGTQRPEVVRQPGLSRYVLR
jgi:hypothetical protein